MAKVAVVGHDEEGRGPLGPGHQPDLVDEHEDDVVGGPAPAVANANAGGDPLISKAAIGRSVEDEFDGGGWRDGGPEAPDERGCGCGARCSRQGV